MDILAMILKAIWGMLAGNYTNHRSQHNFG